MKKNLILRESYSESLKIVNEQIDKQPPVGAQAADVPRKIPEQNGKCADGPAKEAADEAALKNQMEELRKQYGFYSGEKR